jgi:uncharacterized membrane protein YdjX (TVP38/TMEM64 family)
MTTVKPSQAALAARVAAAALLAGGLVAALVFLPVGEWTQRLVNWARAAGTLGVAVYSIAYLLATVLALPGSILTLGAGFAYGPFWGTLLVSPVSVISAAAAWFLGRTVARGWVKRRMEKHPKFAAIDRAIGQGGFRVVLLLRLSPILPFNILNYALSLTQVRFWDYVLGSLFGMFPGTVLYVYLGSLVTSAGQLASGKPPPGGPWSSAFYIAGLLATVVATVLITRLSRRELRRALGEDSGAAVAEAHR